MTLLLHSAFGRSVNSVTPLLLFAVMFGLSMDYMVIMFAHMREEYLNGRPHREAVLDGLRHTAAMVNGGAVIMIGVFASFSTAQISIVQEIGIGLAVAVFPDAVLIRLVIMPSTLLLIGPRVWGRRAISVNPRIPPARNRRAMAEHTPLRNQLVPPRHSPVTSADDQENRSNAARPGGHERTGNDESAADRGARATIRWGRPGVLHPRARASRTARRRQARHPRRQAAARGSAGRVRGGDVPDAGGLRPAVGRQFQLPGFPARTSSGSGFGRQQCGARLVHQGAGSPLVLPNVEYLCGNSPAATLGNAVQHSAS